MVVTEIVQFRVESTTELDTLSTEAGKTFGGLLWQIASLDGCLSVYWARQHECPNAVNLLVNWETIKHQQKFMGSDAYGNIIGQFSSLTLGPVEPYHVHLQPSPASKLFDSQGPIVIEFLNLYFPIDYSLADQQSFHQARLETTTSIMSEKASGFNGLVGGWVIEKRHPNLCEGEGLAESYVLAIGWESVEKHIRFKSDEAFKEVVDGLKESTGLIAYSTMHLPLVRVPKP